MGAARPWSGGPGGGGWFLGNQEPAAHAVDDTLFGKYQVGTSFEKAAAESVGSSVWPEGIAAAEVPAMLACATTCRARQGSGT